MTDPLPYFARFIGPLDAGTFFRQYWSRQFLHISGGDREALSILTVTELDRYFQTDQLPAAVLNVFTSGRPVPLETWTTDKASDRGHFQAVDLEKLFRTYSEGATIVINQADRSIPALSDACRHLMAELGFRVWANVYITPPNSYGFSRHADDHEVFVCQVHGSKHWSIFPDAAEPEELRLRSGDILYLPRSTEHSARSAEHASIHVTFGMNPNYEFDLVRELADAARRDPEFQKPLTTFLEDADDLETEKVFAGKITALLQRVWGERRRQNHVRRFRGDGTHDQRGRLADILLLDSITGRTIVRLRQGVQIRLRENTSEIRLERLNQIVDVPKFMEPLVNTLSSGNSVSIQALAGLLSEEGKIQTVRSLLEAGIVTIVQLG